MNKAKQLALGQILNLPADHSAIRDLLADADTVALSQIAEITKEDFLTAQADGKSFFSFRETWEHMDEAIAYLREKGVDIRGTDFNTKVADTKTAINLADDVDMLAKVFTPTIWKGQFDAMLTAWYGLGTTNAHRDKLDFVAIQEPVAAFEGRICRLGQLKKMDISTSEIRTAVTNGDYAAIREKMAKHGDHFRKEDVFIFDNWGDHTLDNSSGWKNFEKLWDELARNGERLEVEDLLYHVGTRDSILKDAQDASDGLTELFRPRLWHNRAGDVIRLYSELNDASKAKVNIDNVLEELVGHDFGERVESGDIASVKDVTDPVNGADRDKPDYHPILPLGLKDVWNKIARVHELLKAHGEAITLSDLRLTSGLHDETCLQRAARFGAFDKVMDIVRAENGRLSVEELTDKDGAGKATVDYLAENGQIKQILDPRDWVGRAPELARLWQAIPEKGRDQVNFQQIIGNVNTLALRQKFADRMPVPSG